jgi:Uma2 family endonuclease
MQRAVMKHVPKTWTLADFLRHLGNISPNRVRMHPWPGTAVESDVTSILEAEKRVCELIDWTLVEKLQGVSERYLVRKIAEELRRFLKAHELGLAAEGAISRMFPGLVRILDAMFVSWESLGGRKPHMQIASFCPDLVVDVMGEGNSRREAARKRNDYFTWGVSMVWQVEAVQHYVDVYTAPEMLMRCHETDTLEGGKILPGFSLSLQDLFAGCQEDEPKAPPARPNKKRRK